MSKYNAKQIANELLKGKGYFVVENLFSKKDVKKAKDKKYSNIELDPLKNEEIKLGHKNISKFPNDTELTFPTCLAFTDKTLAVGVGGEKFKSKVFYVK